jgi:flagellar biogenesis protein FliO
VLLSMNHKKKKTLTASWRDWWRARLTHRRQLRLTETLGLGEHRFVAVIEFERRRFLLGGTARSLTLLTELAAAVTVRADVPADGETNATHSSLREALP